MSRGIVLFGHGSRDPKWREAIDAVAERIRQRDAAVAVSCAFLELQQPDLGTCIGQLARAGATSVTVLPMFLGTGRHAREDLPVLLAQARARNPQLAVLATDPIGDWPEVLDLLADEALKRS